MKIEKPENFGEFLIYQKGQTRLVLPLSIALRFNAWDKLASQRTLCAVLVDPPHYSICSTLNVLVPHRSGRGTRVCGTLSPQALLACTSLALFPPPNSTKVY